jgi:hypothetical protein
MIQRKCFAQPFRCLVAVNGMGEFILDAIPGFGQQVQLTKAKPDKRQDDAARRLDGNFASHILS